MKKDGDNLIQYKLLFQFHDGKRDYTRPDLFLYYRRMSTYLLENQYILLGIINNTKTIVYRVIPYSNNKEILFSIIRIND